MRSQVCRDLDCIAAQIKLAAAEKAKKVADAVISILYIEEKMPFIGIHDSDSVCDDLSIWSLYL